MRGPWFPQPSRDVSSQVTDLLGPGKMESGIELHSGVPGTWLLVTFFEQRAGAIERLQIRRHSALIGAANRVGDMRLQERLTGEAPNRRVDP
ncbi:hypothetical protein HO173_008343 [Letharia columbiana]|uniref:Uncharacterized protein n=1 Tax=Letharia columbiana TaxID=112416 RepID=A0A8H6FRL4_9LECA|nr:uncharacterized protein HO173_008343 [Letharia columbiana]KAF6233411.1 hypothetical protein HO173_008343 [Letharia columbiana]